MLAVLLSEICRGSRKLATTVRALLESGRWLAPGCASRLSPGRLKELVRDRFRDMDRHAGLKSFPRLTPLEIEGRRHFLRLYRLKHLHLAMCCMWTAHMLAGKGLVVPATEQRCFTTVGPWPCMALLQGELRGHRVQSWTAGLGAELGRGLAAWHSIVPRQYAEIQHLAMSCPPDCLEDTAAIGRLDLSDGQRLLVDGALGGLADADFLGPTALSHGDLHGGNFLDVGGGRIGWLDLDAIRFRPRRHDLAVAELQLLGHQPGAVTAFEAAYFVGCPQQRAGWLRQRRRWFAFVSIVQGLNLQMDRALLPGHVRKPQDDRRRVARIHFARAAEAMAAADDGQPAGELVSAILQRAADSLRAGQGRGEDTSAARP